MNSATKSFGEDVRNLPAVDLESRVSNPVLEHAIFRYGLAILSVALALGIKLLLLRFNFPYPLSTSFLAAIAITFWFAGTGPGILALVLSWLAFGYFILPNQIDYRLVLPDGSIKPVYLPTVGVSHLLYLAYFGLVALLMSWFSSSRRRAERLLDQARNELEVKVEERTAKLSRLYDELLSEISERGLAQDQLRQTEQRLRDLIANAPVVLFALDASGVVTLSEGKGLETFGVKPGELVGKSIFDLYQDSPGLHSNARRALDGEAMTFTTEANDQFFEIHLIPLLNKSGKVAGVNGVTYNITDRRRAERELRLVIDTIPAMAWSTLPNGANDYCSKSWLEYTGMAPGTELDHGWLDAFHPDDRPAHLEKWRAATEAGELFESVARIRGANGEYRWFLTQGVPLRDESGKVVRWYGTNVDIDEQKRAQSLLEGEKNLLEMIATGVALKEILNGLCLTIEGYHAGTLASVLLLNQDGVHLDSVAGPNLPEGWTKQMEKLPIGPCAGSCGTAAYRASPVIVSDIATDPLWDVPEHRASALQHGLRASWSSPILSSKGKVLGTFCLYYRTPRSPDSHDLGVIETATHLARVAIERDRAEEALRASEQVARGQVEALSYSLDVLATAPAPDKFLGQMLSTIGRLLDAQSVIFWLLDDANDALIFRAAAQGLNLAAGDSNHPYIKDPLAWKENKALQEMIFTGTPFICEDMETDPRFPIDLREYFRSKGTKKSLTIPTLVGGRVKGFIAIRHEARPPYRPEEIELAQALAHQAMLAIQLNELAEQSQRAAILEERTRMARDIHDTLAQGFTGVVVQMEAAEEALLDEDPEQAVSHVRRARELARESLGEARRSVHALRPQALEQADFADALKAIIKNTAAGTSLRTDFQVKGKPRELHAAVEENLLHIGQEALTNALKHAHATRFQARLCFDPDAVRLELHDNGVGFVVDQVNGGGIGLIGMKERADHIGGTLAVSSAPGAGTSIVAISPYQTG